MSLVESVLGASSCVGCGRREGPLCGACRRTITRAGEARVPDIDRVITPWRYEGAARSLILGLKLRGRRDFAGPLAEAMARQVAMVGADASALTWVPGRRRETKRRGYDHAHLLAVETGKLLGLPVLPLLSRARAAIDQTELGAVERAANLRGVFRSAPAAGRIALVDDLVTTGATARACAAALRQEGAAGIEVMAPAHAERTP